MKKYLICLFVFVITFGCYFVYLNMSNIQLNKYVLSKEVKTNIWNVLNQKNDFDPNVKITSFEINEHTINKTNGIIKFQINLNHRQNLSASVNIVKGKYHLKYANHYISNTFKQLDVDDTTKLEMMFCQYNYNSTKTKQKIWAQNQEAIVYNANNSFDFGKITKVAHNKSGLDYKVIQTQNNTSSTILFAGTQNDNKKNLLSLDLMTDLSYISGQNIPMQGQEAYKIILKQLNASKGDVYLSGHSLGGMNIIYAYAKLAYVYPQLAKRIYVDIYETPNIYKKLSPVLKSAINKYKNHINNYQVANDVIATSFQILPTIGNEHVGVLRTIKSEKIDSIMQIHNLNLQRSMPYINLINK